MKKGIKIAVLVLLLSVGSFIFSTNAHYLTDERDDQAIDSRSDQVEAIIRLQPTERDGIILTRNHQGKESALQALKMSSERAKVDVLDLLSRKNANVKQNFWVANAILVEASPATLKEVAKKEEVVAIHKNFKIEFPELETQEVIAQFEEDDNYTWGLERMNVDEVWSEGYTGYGVRVAVLDSGVDISHPDLFGRMRTTDPEDNTYPGGWAEFDSNGNKVEESTPHDTIGEENPHGHGTHVSGTIVGGSESGAAIGVSPDAELLHALIMNERSGTFSQALSGFQWALEEEADIVNMSFGASGYYDFFEEPIQNIIAAGAFPVAAIGNNGAGTASSPGVIYESFAVGASNQEDEIASFSSGGIAAESFHQRDDVPEEYVKPDFSAPGVYVLSTVAEPEEGWMYMQGTSMASPHVAGVIALLLEARPNLTPEEGFEALKMTARYFEAEGTLDDGEDKNIRYGYGIVDAKAALDYVLQDRKLTVEEPEGYSQICIDNSCYDEEDEWPYEQGFSWNEEINLEVEVDTGYSFLNWEGEVSSPESSETSVVMDKDKKLSVNTLENPQLETGDPETGASAVTLKGEILSWGGCDLENMELFFDWKTSGDEEWGRVEAEGVEENIATREIIDLQSNTEYSFIFIGICEGLEFTGEEVGFITEKRDPTVTTEQAEEITTDSATLFGQINDPGDYTHKDIQIYIEYREDETEAEWISTESETSSEEIEAWEITGLDPDTVYKYRMVAEYDEKLLEGETLNFKTLSEPFFEVTITDFSEIIGIGDNQVINFEVENSGEADGTQNLNLKIIDSDSEETYTDEKEVFAQGNSSVSDSFELSIKEENFNFEEYTIIIESEDDSDEQSFSVIPRHNLKVTEPEGYSQICIDNSCYDEEDEWPYEQEFLETEEVSLNIEESDNFMFLSWVESITGQIKDLNLPETSVIIPDEDLEISASLIAIPEIKTSEAQNITTGSATLYGELIGPGEATQVELYFKYGEEATEKNLFEIEESEEGDFPIIFSKEVEGLSSSTDYEYKIVADFVLQVEADQVTGIVEGEKMSFTTVSPPTPSGGGGGGGGSRTPRFNIEVTVNNLERGSATGGGRYLEGEEVLLRAVANEGYIFSGWVENGSVLSTQKEYRFVAERDKKVTASFRGEGEVVSFSIPDPEDIKSDIERMRSRAQTLERMQLAVEGVVDRLGEDRRVLLESFLDDWREEKEELEEELVRKEAKLQQVERAREIKERKEQTGYLIQNLTGMLPGFEEERRERVSGIIDRLRTIELQLEETLYMILG